LEDKIIRRHSEAVCSVVIFLILICFHPVQSASRPNPGWRVDFHFSGQIDTAYIKNHIFQPTKIFEPSQLPPFLTDIYTRLASAGYPLARLDSVLIKDTPDCRVDIFINPGPELISSANRLTGLPVDAALEDLNRENPLTIPTGTRLTTQSLDYYAEEFLQELTNRGFAFAQIEFRPIDWDAKPDSLIVSLETLITPGPFLRLSNVEFPGRKQTRLRLLQLESRLKRGAVFRSKDLAKAGRRLRRLEYLAQVEEPILTPTGPGLVEVRFPVRERSVNRLSGMASVAPENWRPRGELRLDFGNLAGTGRRLQLAWLGLNPQRRGIQVSYLEPWILDQPLSFQIGLNQRREDTLGTSTKWSGEFAWKPESEWEAAVGIAQEAIVRTKGYNDSNMVFKTGWLVGRGLFDTRSESWNPRSGYRVSASTEWGWRRRRGGRTVWLKREGCSGEITQAVYQECLVYAKISGEHLTGPGILPEDWIWIGGAGKIRGYREDYWPAHGVVGGSLELRWRPDEGGFLGLFLDGGYIYKPCREFSTARKRLLSYGLTAGFLTRAGRLGLDLGPASGEPLSQARLHFRLESRF